MRATRHPGWSSGASCSGSVEPNSNWHTIRGMADIFLSYAREDRDRAGIIARLVASGGWTVFWDANIKAKAEWRSVLQS